MAVIDAELEELVKQLGNVLDKAERRYVASIVVQVDPSDPKTGEHKHLRELLEGCPSAVKVLSATRVGLGNKAAALALVETLGHAVSSMAQNCLDAGASMPELVKAMTGAEAVEVADDDPLQGLGGKPTLH
jgi:hypothetical protein